MSTNSKTTNRRLTLALILTCTAQTAVSHQVPGQEIDALAAAKLVERAVVQAVERAEQSVVAIARVAAPQTTRPGEVLDVLPRPTTPNPADPDYIPQSFGSGVVIEHPDRPDERFVLTTYHVVMGTLAPVAEQRAAGVSLYVTLPGRTVVDAEIVSVELKRVEGQIESAYPYLDLAVLRLDLEGAGLSPGDVPAMKRGDADSLRKGQFVLALGNPYAQARDGSASVSMGMISNISRRPEPPAEGVVTDSEATLHSFGTLLHVDTRLDLGVSGGALINLDGELIGITTSLAALQGYEKSVGYGIPLDGGTWRIVREMLDGLEPDLGFMGVSLRTLTRRELQLDGYEQRLASHSRSGRRPSAAQVLMVSANSPASLAGLQDNDLILSVNEEPVYDAPDLMRTVALLGPDAVTRLEIWRPSQDRIATLNVRLGKWPVEDDTAVVATRQRFEAWRGISVDYPTARRRFLPGDILAGGYPQAVLIINVAPDSPAHRANLSSGQFIQRVGNRAVQTPAEFYAAVSDARGSVELTLMNGERRIIPVP